MFFNTDKTNGVVTVAGMCNSVGGVFLTCHRSAGGEYRILVDVKARVVNRKQVDAAASIPGSRLDYGIWSHCKL